jgi:hypothetical protein
MKKMFVVFMMALALTGCGEPKVEETAKIQTHTPILYTFDEWKEESSFDDDDVIKTFEDSEVTASKEYWETVTYNSQKNRYFGE